jgi:hypothetical protein
LLSEEQEGRLWAEERERYVKEAKDEPRNEIHRAELDFAG